MTDKPTPPKWTPPPPAPEVKPIVHRTISLRVDLRALAALGGALIIIGSFLPWVAPQFQPIVRLIGPATTGGWPILLFGVLAIVLQFWPQWRTPRVSLPTAALGLAAGALALSSALNTIGLGRAVLGEQTISPLIGVGLGVYLTLAGAFIAVLAGLAPMPPTHEPARAELRLWKASTAIFGAVVILCGLSAVMFGSWIGSGGLTGPGGTPTPIPFNAGILATPLINVEVNPLSEETGVATEPSPTPEFPTAAPAPTEAPLATQPPLPTELPTLVPTRVPPATFTPTSTHTLTPTPSATLSSSPLGTPTTTPTSTTTPTPTPTPTSTS
ncbi:MAG TPA: hypothetical protein VMP08_07570 [Anaerolineae bacterium]|nr:hypothetical protein [Anaerolineae bacterium]